MSPPLIPLITLIELGMTSWTVIMLRSARLAMAPLPLTGQDLREAERMVAEKGDAWLESAASMARHTFRAQSRFAEATLRMWMSPSVASFQATTDLSTRTLASLSEAALRPYGRRSRANARRLSSRPAPAGRSFQ